ncbi:MAG: sialidase family protein [Acidobacteria bacterium]|nr:sialidase family protein [Acidobacteriota bacterium]
MEICAGTSEGVFIVAEGAAKQVLQSRDVRELIRIDGSYFAGTDDGLYVSNDSGRTWAPSGLQGREVWQVRADGSGTLYAGTAPTGLFRSDDHGATWTEVVGLAQLADAGGWQIPLKPPVAARARALVVDGTRILIGVEVGGLALSEDAGETWSVVLPGDNPDLHMLFAHPVEPDTLYASTGYGRLDGVAEMVEGNAGVFRSDDGGRTWTYAWKGITPRYSRPMCVDHRSPYGLTVASAPSAFSNCREENGAQAMLFRSEDGGESWRSLCDEAHSPSAANFHGLAVDPKVPGGVLVGTDTGEVWRVSDRAGWELCGKGMPTVLSLATTA